MINLRGVVFFDFVRGHVTITLPAVTSTFFTLANAVKTVFVLFFCLICADAGHDSF